MPTSRLLVVQNTPTGGPGRLGSWLTDAAVELDVVHAYDGAELPDRPTHQGMLVLGGGFMPDDDARAPWLARTRALAAATVERGLPYLGICLGGQLLAHVAGGTVRARHGTPEVGSTRLTVRPDAAGDRLFGDLPATVSAVERHVDAITALPPGAAWLAESAACPYQAFRVGDRAWGLQFHPEAGAEQVRGWDPDGIRTHGLDPDEVRRQAEADEPAAAPVWRQVARRFAALVTSAGGGDAAGSAGR